MTSDGRDLRNGAAGLREHGDGRSPQIVEVQIAVRSGGGALQVVEAGPTVGAQFAEQRRPNDVRHAAAFV